MALSDLFKNIYGQASNFFNDYVLDFDFSDPSQTGLLEDALSIFQTKDATTGKMSYDPKKIAGGIGAILPFVLPDSFTDAQVPPTGYQGGTMALENETPNVPGFGFLNPTATQTFINFKESKGKQITDINRENNGQRVARVKLKLSEFVLEFVEDD